MINQINQNWIFGRYARVSFSPPSYQPSPSNQPNMNTYEGCASISDTNGNLVLYTDGVTVWNSQDNAITNSNATTNLVLQGGLSSTQSAIIVPQPDSTDKYYIFTADGTGDGASNNSVVACALIDTSDNTGHLVPMSSDPTLYFLKSPTEKLAVIQHSNCKDFWVVTIMQEAPQEASNGKGIFFVYKATAMGVEYSGQYAMGLEVHDKGYLKGSRNGERLAVANWSNKNVLVYKFDCDYGSVDVANPIMIFDADPLPNVGFPPCIYGVEFSPDSTPDNNLLYYTVVVETGSGLTSGFVYQVNLANALTSSVLVGQRDNGVGALQLGMDDRIYIAMDGEPRLGVIDSPNLAGTPCHCNLTPYSGTLEFGSEDIRCYLGLPNQIANLCTADNPCADAVEEANDILNGQAGEKFFVIPAHGQIGDEPCEPVCSDYDFSPIFTLHWGDGLSDQFESHDTEIIYIRVRNPYANLTFRGVRIFNIQISPNQLVGGEDAVQLIPSQIVCFDEIGPCSYVSRDFALLIQNAIPGTYDIKFDYCIEEIAITAGGGSHYFQIPVVAS